MSKLYRKTDVQRHRCETDVGGCGSIVSVQVMIHKESGVAGFTCPKCDKTQEPNPIR